MLVGVQPFAVQPCFLRLIEVLVAQGGTGGGCTANDPLPFPVEVDDAVWSIPPVSSITLGPGRAGAVN
jgi:hypothetical protein